MENNELTLSCRLCKNTQNNILMNVNPMENKKVEKFAYVFCNQCHSLTMLTTPKNLNEYYKNYYSLALPCGERKNKLWTQGKKFLCKNLYLRKLFACCIKDGIDTFALKSVLRGPLHHTDHILDVGCGSGRLVYDLCELGFVNTIGIEPFGDKDITYANGAKIYKKKFLDIDQKFNLITFHHTMEHFEDLDPVFKKIYQILLPQGVCIIRMPNIDSFAFKRFGKYWTGIHAPFHLNLPSYSIIQNLAAKNNLAVEKIRGEQLHEHFLANVENEIRIIEDTTYLFKKFAQIHSSRDVKYWKKKQKFVLKSPILSEWIIYYLSKRS